jgi:hypothetical protein
MENLGYVFEKPVKNKDGNWNSVDIFYKNDEEYLGATSKLIKMFQSPNGDGKCIVLDNDHQKHLMDVVHVTFDYKSNSVRLFPYEYRMLSKTTN